MWWALRSILKMFEFSFGVACAANKFLYCMQQMIVSIFCCLWVAGRGKELEQCGPKTMGIVTNQKQMYKGRGTT